MFNFLSLSVTFFYNRMLLVKGCDRLQKAEQLQIGHLTFVASDIMTHGHSKTSRKVYACLCVCLKDLIRLPRTNQTHPELNSSIF